MSLRVSVVFPAAPDRPDLVERSIYALRHQTLDPSLFEVVVAVDGGDVSGAFGQLRPTAHPFALTLVGSPRRSSDPHIPHRNHARNAGCRVAKGEILWVWDSDFLLWPRALAHLVAAYDEGLRGGVIRSLTCCLKTYPRDQVSPDRWLSASASWVDLERADAPEADRRAAFDRLWPGGDLPLTSRIYSGFGEEWTPSEQYRTRRSPDLLEGFPSVPRRIWEALGGFDEFFIGWGGNKEEFVDRLHGLVRAGLLDLRLLFSVLAIHQPHPMDPESRAMTPRRARNHQRREARKGEIKRHSKWWQVQRVKVQAAVEGGMRMGALTPPGGICCLIFTFDRPQQCLDLLRQIEAQRDSSTSVMVFDDHSTENYRRVRDWCGERSWARYTYASQNHGKVRFWAWVASAYRTLENEPADLFCLLQDDVALCDGFFDRCRETWGSLPKKARGAINLLHDTARESGIWGAPLKSQQVSESVLVDDTDWVDCLALVGWSYFEALGWMVPPVDPGRWEKSPTLGSGVGEGVTKALRSAGLRMYRVRESLVAHRIGESKMNARQRRSEPLLAREIAGGNAMLEFQAPVTACLASIPRRRDALQEVVDRLLPQVSAVKVYLNGYEEVPNFLIGREKVEVARSQDYGDNGDAGKFWWSDKLPAGYVVICDDDVRYPSDFVRHMIGRVEQYGRRAIVGVHGVTLRFPCRAYYTDRDVLHYRKGLAADTQVHIIATNSCAYHSSVIEVCPEDFKLPNMADIWLAILAQQQGIPMFAVARSEGWLDDIPETARGSIYVISHKTAPEKCPMTTAINDLGRWTLPKLPARPAQPVLAPPAPDDQRLSATWPLTVAGYVGRHVAAAPGPVAVLGPQAGEIATALGPKARPITVSDLRQAKAGGFGAVIFADALGVTDAALQEIATDVKRALVVRRGAVVVIVECMRLGNRGGAVQGLRDPIEFQRLFTGIGVLGQIPGPAPHTVLGGRVLRR